MTNTLLVGAVLTGIGLGILIAVVASVLSLLRDMDGAEDEDDQILANLGAAISNPKEMREEVENATSK